MLKIQSLIRKSKNHLKIMIKNKSQKSNFKLIIQYDLSILLNYCHLPSSQSVTVSCHFTVLLTLLINVNSFLNQ